MSLHYILDGYNITCQISTLALKDRQNSREGLIRLVEVYKPQGSAHNRVTIVFDGKSGILSDARVSSVKVVFSENESADDKIRRIIGDSAKKKQMIVVTDDKELRFSVRALGAEAISVADFLSKFKKQGTQVTRGTPAKNKEDEKHISKTLEYQITSELERIWLKGDKRKE